MEQENRKMSIFEIKFSKTPKKQMTANLGRFKENSPKLEVLNSKIITLNDDRMQLTRDISSIRAKAYIDYIKG